jgi:hypothetical protein
MSRPALQGNFGTGVQLNLRKHPNAYIAIKQNYLEEQASTLTFVRYQSELTSDK